MPDSNLLVHEACKCSVWVARCMVALPHVLCYLMVHVALKINILLCEITSNEVSVFCDPCSLLAPADNVFLFLFFYFIYPNM